MALAGVWGMVLARVYTRVAGLRQVDASATQQQEQVRGGRLRSRA